MSGKRILMVLLTALVLVGLLVSCAPKVVKETVVVEKPVEKKVVETVVVEKPVEKVVKETVVVEKPVEKVVEVTPEPVTLSVWYLSQSPEEIQLVEELSAKFEERHPGVKIDFSAYGYDEMVKTLKLALDSHTGPDIAYGQPGGIGHVAYARAGHLVELTEIMKERGWDQNHPMDAIMYWQKELGGPVYALPYDITVVGVFYNKDIFSSLGLEPPTTWEEFEDILATLKDNGYTPFSCGAMDGWTYDHYFQALLHVTTPIEKIEALKYVRPGVSFTEASFVQAAKILKDWIDKGYFNDNFLAASYDDQNNLFITEQVAMNIGGTWNNATFLQQADFDVGFFALPRVNPDIEWHSILSPNNVWMISQYSEHKDLAIEYLDYMLSAEVARALWNSGDIPTYKFASPPEPTSDLQADVYKVTQETGIGYYFNDNAPERGEAEISALQAMAAGDLTPEEAMAEIEKVNAKVVAEAQQ